MGMNSKAVANLASATPYVIAGGLLYSGQSAGGNPQNIVYGLGVYSIALIASNSIAIKALRGQGANVPGHPQYSAFVFLVYTLVFTILLFLNQAYRISGSQLMQRLSAMRGGQQ